MATSTYPSKRFFKAGAKKAAVWETAVALGAGFKLFVDSDGNPDHKQSYVQHQAIGMYVPTGGRLGQLGPIDFSPESDLLYDHGIFSAIIAALFGTTSVSGSAPAGYTHVWKWADACTNFFTYAVERPGRIWEAPSCFPIKVNIKLAAGLLKTTITLRATKLIVDSAVNTFTQMDALTMPVTALLTNEIRLGQLQFMINAESGAALTAPTDVLVPSDFDLTWERDADAVYAAGSECIILPKEKAPKWNVKVTFPRTLAADFDINEFKAMTPYKAQFLFTGPIAVGAVPYTFKALFPRLVLTDVPKKPLADIMTTMMEFVGEESAAAPTGMTGYTRPGIEVLNMQATDYLA